MLATHAPPMHCGWLCAQWLNLRRVRRVGIDPDRYPQYDESLLQSFQRETEMFLANNLREDRSVTEL
jgi:hypothetical protein